MGWPTIGILFHLPLQLAASDIGQINTPETEMTKLSLVSMIVPAALLALFVAGCRPSSPQQLQEFEAKPTSSFAGGEAISIVQTLLGQRTYSYTICTDPLISGTIFCPRDALQQRVSNCLEYLNEYKPDWSESFQSDGVWRVTRSGFRDTYVWDVYEQSWSVRTVSAPVRGNCQ